VRRSSVLPEGLKPLFWEVDFSSIAIEGHETYIIERILELGNDAAISWLLKSFPKSLIAQVVRESRRISRNTATLWALVLDIPRENIQCLTKPSLLLRAGSFAR
jgi:hypothetical protein